MRFAVPSVVLLVVVGVILYRHFKIRPQPAAPSVDDIDKFMAWGADLAVSEGRERYGKALDYSPNSVKSVEEILGRLHDQNTAQLMDNQRLSGEARMWGGYIGEVIRRIKPAHWEKTSAKTGATTPLVFGTDDEMYPCSWCYHRIVNGPEDNVWNKFAILILQHGKPVLEVRPSSKPSSQPANTQATSP